MPTSNTPIHSSSQHSISSSDSDNMHTALSEYEQSKETMLLNSLLEYYVQHAKPLSTIIAIITEDSNVSLRVIDWFVTNYGKRKQEEMKESIHFRGVLIYNDYKVQLKMFNKKLFDPFSRVAPGSNLRRFAFHYDDNKHIMTTVGQLNFFRWAHDSGVLDYVTEHLEEIKLEIKQKDRSKRNKSNEGLIDSASASEWNVTSSARKSVSSSSSSSRESVTNSNQLRNNLPANFTISFG